MPDSYVMYRRAFRGQVFYDGQSTIYIDVLRLSLLNHPGTKNNARIFILPADSVLINQHPFRLRCPGTNGGTELTTQPNLSWSYWLQITAW